MTEPAPEPGPQLPRWVPIVIGGVLVIMAALAVYTGIRYRSPALASDIIPAKRSPRAVSSGGPPGEPEAGASLIFPGDSGDNAPTASAPVSGRARATITGGKGGVDATPRLWARRGMVTNVLPDDAMIYVNDLAIGEAKQFNTMDEVYDFPEPGSYSIRIVAPGYREQRFIITAADSAKQEIARIDAKLVR